MIDGKKLVNSYLVTDEAGRIGRFFPRCFSFAFWQVIPHTEIDGFVGGKVFVCKSDIFGIGKGLDLPDIHQVGFPVNIVKHDKVFDKADRPPDKVGVLVIIHIHFPQRCFQIRSYSQTFDGIVMNVVDQDQLDLFALQTCQFAVQVQYIHIGIVRIDDQAGLSRTAFRDQTVYFKAIGLYRNKKKRER